MESVHTRIEPAAPAAEDAAPDADEVDDEGESLPPHADRTPTAATPRPPKSIERRVMSGMWVHLSRQLDAHRRARSCASGRRIAVGRLQHGVSVAKCYTVV
ncbi:hypothetical protein [Cutibacterium avidum]|uniref:hypothetical protein n=1 Tax=Cutibacterium avidum TaxID=33010 RepID=UPI0035291552